MHLFLRITIKRVFYTRGKRLYIDLPTTYVFEYRLYAVANEFQNSGWMLLSLLDNRQLETVRRNFKWLYYSKDSNSRLYRLILK